MTFRKKRYVIWKFITAFSIVCSNVFVHNHVQVMQIMVLQSLIKTNIVFLAISKCEITDVIKHQVLLML